MRLLGLKSLTLKHFETQKEARPAVGRYRGRTRESAADVLGLTVDAVRKRVKRGTLESEKDADGRLYVFLDTDQESDHPRSDTERLISTLEEQLRLEREAHAEARRIIAGLVERVPALEAPSEPSEAPTGGAEPRPSTTGPPEAETPAEVRPWWRRVFGG